MYLLKDNLLRRVFAATKDDDVDLIDNTKEPVVAEADKETTRGAVRKEPDEAILPPWHLNWTPGPRIE